MRCACGAKRASSPSPCLLCAAKLPQNPMECLLEWSLQSMSARDRSQLGKSAEEVGYLGNPALLLVCDCLERIGGQAVK